jgi:hypothetical protein
MRDFEAANADVFRVGPMLPVDELVPAAIIIEFRSAKFFTVGTGENFGLIFSPEEAGRLKHALDVSLRAIDQLAFERAAETEEDAEPETEPEPEPAHA